MRESVAPIVYNRLSNPTANLRVIRDRRAGVFFLEPCKVLGGRSFLEQADSLLGWNLAEDETRSAFGPSMESDGSRTAHVA